LLLAKEDPSGDVAAVLAQESVEAAFSGGAMSQPESKPLVEGVRGRGDAFMLGQPTDAVPDGVKLDVAELVHQAEACFGSVELEWVHNGTSAWLLQVHPRPTPTVERGVLSPGNADRWLDFDPKDGLDALRSLVQRAKEIGAGVRVIRPVGVTSHIGDILRAASVPGRLSA
jgi:hypothetical protein